MAKVRFAIVTGTSGEVVLGGQTWQGGGPVSALRAYQAYHPDAAIYQVTHNGRTVWMTSKQQAIWRECKKYHLRGKRLTQEFLARKTGASRATISRFLRRLDLWRFIDCVTLLGRKGGTYIFTRHGTSQEADANASGARHTYAARKRARDLLAGLVKRRMLAALEPLLRHTREAWKASDATNIQLPLYPTFGSTGATFRP